MLLRLRAFHQMLVGLAAATFLTVVVASAAAEKLRIATTGDYPPFNHVDEAGRIAGFDVDIARALCAKLGAACELVLEEWEKLIPELRAGGFDAIAASMSITEKRRELVSFTTPYYENIVRFVAHKSSAFDPAELAGRKIGTMRATVSADWLAEHSTGASVRLYRDQAGLRFALNAGLLDAALGDGLGFLEWLQGPAGRRFQFVGAGLRIDEGIGIAVRREDEELLDRLNRALGRVFADGTYGRINARYFPFSIRPK